MNREPTAFAAGRYLVCDEIAHGGMATVHFGRLRGPLGFSRSVAIKRLHPQLGKDAQFVTMFLDEARLACRIRHPNVVPTLDVVTDGDEILLVMEYVHGESLAELLAALAKRDCQSPPAIAATIMVGVLHGLHAAHEATDAEGRPLGIVHRDVSPQNILVGQDGVPRVLDFGIAKARGRASATRTGQIKGKLAYMAPEQVRGLELTRQTDVFAASVVLWNMLSGRRLFKSDNEAAVVLEILERPIIAPSRHNPDVTPELDAVVLRGLERDPEKRHASALEMATALERATGVVSQRELADWVQSLAADRLARRAQRLAEIETSPALPTADESPHSEPAPERAKRRWPLAIAAVVLLAIGGVAGMWGARAASAEAPPIASSSAPPPASQAPAATAEPEPAVPSGSVTPSARPAISPPAPARTEPRASRPRPRRAPPPLYARE